MTAQLIDGNALSRQLRAQVASRAAALKARGVTPGLAVVLVGDNPASQVYVRNKVKACVEAGLHSVLEKYEATLTEAELLARIASGAIDEHPAYEHYLAARILADTHAAARQVVGSKLQEINRG